MPEINNPASQMLSPVGLIGTNDREVVGKDATPNVPYTEKEKQYISYLQQRLELARNIRNQNHDEFDGMTYMQYYESNLKGANSYIQPKKNKEDSTFVSGSTRQAILSLEARINQLNFTTVVRAYNKEIREDVNLGQAMSDILFKAGKLDNDDEKRFLRQYELYVQGTVFVEEVWQEYYKTNKDFNAKTWDKTATEIDWKARLELVDARCTRNLLPGPNVFLGSFTEMEMDFQPYSYTVDYIPYEDAFTIFGTWERWKYVTKDIRLFASPPGQAILYNNWRLQQTRKNMVEIIKYEDLPQNEYMILLNGVMMMPIGFPRPWTYQHYHVVKQIYEPITPFCAYGGSMVKRLKSSQMMEDEFWRLSLLKTQKSFIPAVANMSGKILSSKMFMPGKIVNGVSPDSVKPLFPPDNGVTQSEYKMMEMLKQNIQDNSFPSLVMGQEPQDPNQPATTTNAMMTQAKIMLGLAVFSAMSLEKKLGELRLFDVLENWFESTGTEADMVKREIVNKYRSVSAEGNIPGYGKGRRIVRMTDSLPESEDIYDEEEDMGKEEGKPVRITYLNPKEVKSVIQYWYVDCEAREQEDSDLSRVLFGNMITQLQQMGEMAQAMPGIKMDFVEERFSEVWKIPMDKAFSTQAQQALQGQQPMTPPQGSQVPPGGINNQMTQGVKQQVPRPSLNTLKQNVPTT